MPQCCQHKLGMFIMQLASSSSPKSGQFAEKAPRNRTVCIIHNAGSKINSYSSPTKLQAQQGVVFDTVKLERMMCSFAEPEGRYSQVNKDDNEVAAFGPENTTWEPFFLGRSYVQIQYAGREKSRWSSAHTGAAVRVEFIKNIQSQEGSIHPFPFPSASPSGDCQVSHKVKALGLWFCHQKGLACGVCLGNKNQKRTRLDLSDTIR